MEVLKIIYHESKYLNSNVLLESAQLRLAVISITRISHSTREAFDRFETF